MQFKQGENYAMCTEKMYWTNANAKIGLQFRAGNFNLEDAPRSERPLEADVDKIKSLVDENRRTTTREIAERWNVQD